jgi:hypothetical protein
MAIRAVPVCYAGVLFRSTLEADWAATLDSLAIDWQYEPEAVRLPSGELYRPDFYLPRITTWLEVKGPHEERLAKAIELARAVDHHPDCTGATGDYERCCQGEYQLVVVGLAPVRGQTTWKVLCQVGGEPYDDGCLQECGNCGAWYWHGLGAYGCRAHRRHGYGDDDLGGAQEAPFVQIRHRA